MKILPRAALCLGASGALALATPSLVGLIELDSSTINADVEKCVPNLGESPKEVDVLPVACKTFENSFTVKTETVSLRNYSGVSILKNVVKYELPSASTFKQAQLITPEVESHRHQENRELGYLLGGLCTVMLFGMYSLAEHTRSRNLSTDEQAAGT